MERSSTAGASTIASALLVLVLAGCAPDSTYPGNLEVGSTPTRTAPTGSATLTLTVAESALGPIVVDGEGRVVYVFDADVRDSGESACDQQCQELWPPVTSDAEPVADGVDGELATISGADGVGQVTFNGLPLYRYANDSAPGDANGQGAEGDWWVITPDGQKVAGSSDY